MESKIREFFKPFTYLGPRDYLVLLKHVRYRKVPSGTVLAGVGDCYPKGVAIISGCIRTYILTPQGEERTVRFAMEGEFTGCAGCLLGDKTSFENLEAIEDSVILEVDVPALEQEAKKHPALFRLLLDGFKKVFRDAVDRVQDFVTLSPEQRYRTLLKEHPKAIQRLPQKYLASYLGVTTVSLSRIRARIAQE